MTISINPRAEHLTKLVKVLGMLGSAHAGERAAAGLKAHELVKQNDLSWEEIILTKNPPMIVGDTVEEKIGTILAHIEILSDFEKRFARDINNRGYTLSIKQRECLNRIFKKCIAFRAARGAR